MIYEIMHAFIPLFGLVIYSSSQLFGIRYVAGLSYLKSVVFGFGFGLFIVVSLELVFILSVVKSLSDSIALFVVSIITYCLLGLCYFAFINLPVSALRIRLLRELYESEKGITMKELLMRYNSKEIIEKRINRLINNRQIICKNERYYVKRSITLVMAVILELMRFIILGRKLRINVFHNT